MSNSKKPPRDATRTARSSYDLDEVQPNLFVIGEPQLRGLLKDEGEISGVFFRLGTWRREGLVARIRSRGFSVRLLDERLANLPHLPPPPPPGRLLTRDVTAERANYSIFDADTMRWQQLSPEQPGTQALLSLREGSIVRQRRGRGAATYLQVFAERDHAGLRALDETQALLQVFAQATATAPCSLPVLRQRDGYLLPPPTCLPPPHRELLSLLGEATPAGIQVSDQGWVWARQIYQLLRIKPLIHKEEETE